MGTFFYLLLAGLAVGIVGGVLQAIHNVKRVQNQVDFHIDKTRHVIQELRKRPQIKITRTGNFTPNQLSRAEQTRVDASVQKGIKDVKQFGIEQALKQAEARNRQWERDFAEKMKNKNYPK